MAGGVGFGREKEGGNEGKRKKIAASQPVNLVRTLVVCAPKMFSVTPPPKAAPRPSLFGRCIRMTRVINTATSMSIARKTLMRTFIGSGQYRQIAPFVNALHAAPSSEPRMSRRELDGFKPSSFRNGILA